MRHRGYIRAVFWLRWKLWRRRWHRQGPLLRAIGVLGTIIAIPACILSFVIALGIGVVVLPTASPVFITITWAVMLSFFIYVRIMGLWISLQQDDGLAFDRLLHLPIRFDTVFYISFGLSQVSFSNLFFLPAFLGFAIACAVVLPPGNVVLVPAVLAFALCVGALLQQFQNWLLLSMVNKRKRMVWAYLLFIIVILVAQLPNFYFAVTQESDNTERAQPNTELMVADVVREHSMDDDESSDENVVESNEVTPDHWSNDWVLTASSTEFALPWWTIASTVCLLGLAFLSVRRSYRSTLARYRDGQDENKKAATKAESGSQRSGDLRIARSPIFAVFNVTLKSWVRSTYGKLTLLTPLIFLVLLPVLLMRYPALFEPTSLPLLLIGAVAFIGAPVGLVCNLFAFDRLGFRLYLFAGMNLKYVLVGKFLALLLVFGVISFIIFSLAIAMTSISISHLLGTVLQAGFLFVGCCVVGILWSARYPYAVSFTSMKAHGGTATALAVLVELILMGLVIWTASYVLEIDAALDASNGIPIYFLVSLLEFIVLLALAGLILKPLANYVLDRSNHILEAVAIEN